MPKFTTEQLTEAFNKAKAAALAVDAANSEDGGTCNFDSAIIWFGRTTPAKIQAAAEASGVNADSFSHFGKKCYWIGSNITRGQANRRTRMAEAISESLKESLKDCGLTISMYYQMD